MGHFENSPAFQTPGFDGISSSPAGTAEIGVCASRIGEEGFFSAVPVGLDVFPIGPGIEMPGYFRWFLRNRTLRKN
jgi:hypothetical protein